MFTHPDIEFRLAKQIQHERHLAGARRRMVAELRAARPARTPWLRRRRAPSVPRIAVLETC